MEDRLTPEELGDMMDADQEIDLEAIDPGGELGLIFAGSMQPGSPAENIRTDHSRVMRVNGTLRRQNRILKEENARLSQGIRPATAIA